jgi:purine-binding chemotaxis protein CheW
VNDERDGLHDPDAPVRTSAPAVEVAHFVFHLAGRAYALAPEHVELVAEVTRPVPVPTAPAHLRGVVHLRGRILTVVDLAAVLGLEPGTAGDPRDQRLLVVRLVDQPLAFVVDATAGVLSLPADALVRGDGSERVVAGRLTAGETTITVLFAPALLDAVLGRQPQDAPEATR